MRSWHRAKMSSRSFLGMLNTAMTRRPRSHPQPSENTAPSQELAEPSSRERERERERESGSWTLDGGEGERERRVVRGDLTDKVWQGETDVWDTSVTYNPLSATQTRYTQRESERKATA